MEISPEAINTVLLEYLLLVLLTPLLLLNLLLQLLIVLPLLLLLHSLLSLLLLGCPYHLRNLARLRYSLDFLGEVLRCRCIWRWLEDWLNLWDIDQTLLLGRGF